MIAWIALALVLQAASFEVATIKPNDTVIKKASFACHGTDGGPENIPLGRCVARGVSLRLLIETVYGVPSRDISGGPAWITSHHYDIDAKAEHPVTRQELLLMMQTLMEDRFKLRMHREKRMVQGYSLVTSRRSPRVVKTEDAAPSQIVVGQKRLGAGTVLTVKRSGMGIFAERLSRFVEGPVINKTELDGTYDFVLKWDDATGPSLYTALRSQLGLRLEHRTVRIDFFVIDAAEKPAGN